MSNSPKNFAAFLRTSTGRHWCSPTIYPRLVNAGDFKSLSALERWTRERYPVAYKQYHFLADGTGREMIQKLWAEYLKWRERGVT